ncbi:AAA family ATPase [Catenuloplanes atrovinosus]|uniref:Cell wall assembly regulator SMI1 n=1 Tax=Catenuloplanes atrovinosus TaxID=137266 RepID=A0AAE3YMS2_9ACTN|nr:AAA family ATPase [Catenuloplanes atrovinosus]MDR7275947.1 cell wall assembly regulator SMI1 [Catenuloplanes atrovinosus]
MAVLAAASSVRVAAVAIAPGAAPGRRVRAHAATWVEIHDGDAGPLSLKATVHLVSALAATHGLVLIAGVPGLLVPVGRAGWTVTDLAAMLGAPVVVVTGGTRDAANHATLALGALDRHGLAAVVVATGLPPAAAPAGPPTDDTGAAGPPPAPDTGAAASADRDDSFAATAAGPVTLSATGPDTPPGPADSAEERPGGPTAEQDEEGRGSPAEPQPGPPAADPLATSANPVAEPADAPATPADVHAEPAEPPATPADAHAEPAEPPATPADAHAEPAEPPATPADAHAEPAEPPATPADAHANPADAHADRLPVALAGRIPAGVDSLDAEAARAFLDPLLHARHPAPARPSSPAAPAPPQPAASGTRVAVALGALFVTMSLGAVGLAFCNRPAVQQTTTEVTVTPRWRDTYPAPTPSSTGVPVENVCPTNRPGLTPTRPDPGVTSRVDGAWQRIETWLAAKAPASRQTLRPAADPAAIDAAQRRMSVRFPPDLVASLLRHDGTTAEQTDAFPLPFDYRPLSTTEIADTWQQQCDMLAGTPILAGGGWWDAGYVPFAGGPEIGLLLVDQRPDGFGTVGDFHNDGGVRFGEWRPASIAELLERTATSLETGEPFAGRYRPALAGDRLEWIIQ